MNKLPLFLTDGNFMSKDLAGKGNLIRLHSHWLHATELNNPCHLSRTLKNPHQPDLANGLPGR
jgi:hypothetical protein